MRQPTADTKLADYLAWWLESRVEPRWTPRTAAAYEQVCRLHIAPHLGDIPLDELTVDDIEEWIAIQQSSDAAPATVYKRHAVLSASLKWALGKGLISSNPAAFARPPARPPTQASYLRAEEVRALVHALEGEWHGAAIVTAIRTGMRLGELLGLRWANVETVERPKRIHVVEALPHDYGPPRWHPPKGGRGRVVPVSNSLASLLREHHARVQRWVQQPGVKKWKDYDLVFPSHRGTPTARRELQRTLFAACERSGVERCTFHELRHTFATLLVESGRPLTDVQQLLGHRYYSTTADYYVHLTDHGMQGAADAIDAAIDGDGP